MARCYRKNSLVIDFTAIPVKPTLEQVRSFIFDQLELDISQVKNLQLSMTKTLVFLELGTTEQAETIVARHDRAHSMDVEGQDYPIPIYMADNSVEVKVFDLPPHLPNALIIQHLLIYGDVLSIKDDVWQNFFPGVPNGTRTVRMRLRKSIPSYIKFEDETAYIKYRNQTPTCRYCGRNLHMGSKCSEVKKALAEEVKKTLADSDENGLTLAQIVEGVNPTFTNNQHNPTNQQTISGTQIIPRVSGINDSIAGPSSALNVQKLAAQLNIEISDEEETLLRQNTNQEINPPESQEEQDTEMKDSLSGRPKRPASPGSKSRNNSKTRRSCSASNKK